MEQGPASPETPWVEAPYIVYDPPRTARLRDVSPSVGPRTQPRQVLPVESAHLPYERADVSTSTDAAAAANALYYADPDRYHQRVEEVKSGEKTYVVRPVT